VLTNPINSRFVGNAESAGKNRHVAKGVAKVAAARRLAVRLFWMLRTNTAYPEIAHIESSPRYGVVGES
jgi:hypothetical protein